MTPMTPDQVAAVQAEISSALGAVTTIGSVIAPEYAPFFVLGKALAVASPQLLADVENLISGAAPSDADNAALAAKIIALGNPAAL